MIYMNTYMLILKVGCIMKEIFSVHGEKSNQT